MPLERYARPECTLQKSPGVREMDSREKLMQALSWLLVEVERAQIRGDVELEMNLSRITQTMLSVIWNDTTTDEEKSGAYMVRGSAF
jgi:hypothetical protein